MQEAPLMVGVSSTTIYLQLNDDDPMPFSGLFLPRSKLM